MATYINKKELLAILEAVNPYAIGSASQNLYDQIVEIVNAMQGINVELTATVKVSDKDEIV